jgi:hypothetical protein
MCAGSGFGLLGSYSVGFELPWLIATRRSRVISMKSAVVDEIHTNIIHTSFAITVGSTKVQ